MSGPSHSGRSRRKPSRPARAPAAARASPSSVAILASERPRRGPETRRRGKELEVLLLHRDGSPDPDRKSTRLNSSHGSISYAVFCLKKKKDQNHKKELHQPHSTDEDSS